MFNRKNLDNNQQSYKEQRAAVSRLILNVLCENISVKEALLNFPKDTDDASVNAAWHALSHYESDEDLRKNDKTYKDVQDDFMEFIAFSLRDNKDLPVNIINSYLPYYKDMPIADNSSFKGKLHKLFRFLNIK